MGFFDFLKRRKWEKLGQPIYSKTLYTEIRLMYSPPRITLRDANFRSIKYADWELLKDTYSTPMPFYRSEIADCDDMCLFLVADIRRGWIDKSRGQEALTFGWVTGKSPSGVGHQWIWVRDDVGVYRFVEGQTGKEMRGVPQAYYSFEA